MISSDLPLAYASALSKKFTPASCAAAIISMALLISTWLWKVTQEPNESALTRRPDRPK
jgi:hypothetical protein